VHHPSSPTTPQWQRHQALTPLRFGLIPFRSPLLRESLLLSFPRVTEMFQFTQFPLPALCIQTGVTPHDGCRVSPFGHPRIYAWSAAPRGFSQPPTSFIGSRRQGIHRRLFVAWNSLQRCSCSLCNSQGTIGTHDVGTCQGAATSPPEPVGTSGTPSKRNRERQPAGVRTGRPRPTTGTVRPTTDLVHQLGDASRARPTRPRLRGRAP
jgi:hypothetical protein